MQAQTQFNRTKRCVGQKTKKTLEKPKTEKKTRKTKKQKTKTKNKKKQKTKLIEKQKNIPRL